MNYFDPLHNPGPMIGAHRGYRSIRPENTLCAFEAAIGHCHYIELDVEMTRDGVAIIHHDDLLGRTCNLPEGASPQPDAWTLAEMQQLDFGSWFVREDPFGTIAAETVTTKELAPLLPQRIVTLQELLLWRGRTKIPLNIEIKDLAGTRHDATVVDVVLSAVRAADCRDDVIISSFRHSYLQEIACKMPDVALGALQENENPEDLCAYLKNLGVSAYHPDVEIISDDMIAMLRREGFGVNIFTVNDAEQQWALLRAGATSVITDFPDPRILKGLTPLFER